MKAPDTLRLVPCDVTTRHVAHRHVVHHRDLTAEQAWCDGILGEHRLRVVIEDGDVRARFTCTFPNEAWCHQQCEQRCDAWAEGYKCDHKFVPTDECGILPWYENATWEETHTGTTVLYDGRIQVEIAEPGVVQWSTKAQESRCYGRDPSCAWPDCVDCSVPKGGDGK